MAKRKTELERKEDTLSVVSVGDHDKVVEFQKKLGITIGTVIDILNSGMVYVSDEASDPNTVKQVEVVLDTENKTWNYDRGEDVVSCATADFNKSYALTAKAMTTACVERLQEEAKALEKAATALEVAGLAKQAELLRSQANAKLALTKGIVEPAPTEN